jgi:hypothetical protein
MADPDSPQCITRGIEERLFDAIPARVRMALSYCAPLAGVPGVDFLLQKETLYNSIFALERGPRDQVVAVLDVATGRGWTPPARPLDVLAIAVLLDVRRRPRQRPSSAWTGSPSR